MTNVLPMGYASRATRPATCPRRQVPFAHGVRLLRPTRSLRAAAAVPFHWLGTVLIRHRALTRVSVTALSFLVVIALSQQAPTQAGPEAAPEAPRSLLPRIVGIAVATDQAITIPFNAEMDAASAAAAIQLVPHQDVELSWNATRTELSVQPQGLWRTDAQYIVVVSEAARTADGASLDAAQRFAFTTQTAPAVSDFRVRFAASDLPPAEPGTDLLVESEADVEGDGSVPATLTAKDVSASSAITITFTADMRRPDVERHFAITPWVAGEVTWDGRNLIFTPSERLEPGTRYTISLVGSHDRIGNALGGKGRFSFTVREGAQLLTTEPDPGARDVEPKAVEMQFSQPMDTASAAPAVRLVNATSGAKVRGSLKWNTVATRLTFTPDDPLPAGSTFTVRIREARDADGNVVTDSFSFTTKAPPPAPEAPVAAVEANRSAGTSRGAAVAPPPRRSAPAAAPATSLAGYALNQINAARAAYGFAPLVLDAGISAVASAHAWDQARNNYYSHTSLNGATLYQRLAAGGVSFSAASENQCYYIGKGAQATLNWCHSAFMSEPYPGHWNHIANILNPKWTRVGVGIGDYRSRVVITWDFAN